jgi:hypothetical protein
MEIDREGEGEGEGEKRLTKYFKERCHSSTITGEELGNPNP